MYLTIVLGFKSLIHTGISVAPVKVLSIEVLYMYHIIEDLIAR